MTCEFSARLIEKTIAFHGHSCPGLAIGIRAAELALRELGQPGDVELVAVSETDMCGVDAIQFLTGCTYGKGNFLHRDYGKMAFCFYDRKTGNGVRALLRPSARRAMTEEDGVIMNRYGKGTATDGERSRAKEIRRMQTEHFMELGLDEMFEVKIASEGPPRPAQILETLCCEQCGEHVMESRTRRYAGETLCIPCFNSVEQKI